MKIIISPAKTVLEGNGTYKDLPVFYDEANKIVSLLRKQDLSSLMKIWNCSEKIAAVNQRRLNSFSDSHMAAIERFTGMQYKNLQYETLKDKEKKYIEDNVCILSAMFGILRPSDGIPEYRLDLRAELKINGKDLYGFWQDKPYNNLDDHYIVNLASKEYSDLITPYLGESDCMTSILFLSEKGKSQSTLAKQARGRFLRWLAVNDVKTIEKMKEFTLDNFMYSQEKSDDTHLVFVKCPLQKK